MVVDQKKLEDGMAGGVLAGAEVVKHKNIMVLSTNDVVDDELSEKAIQAAKGAESGVIVGKTVDSYFPGGYLSVDKKGLIIDIVEKPSEGKEPSNLVNIVLHVYNDFPSFLKHLKSAKGKAEGRYERALAEYIKKAKARISVLKYAGFWQPIKFPWDVLKVMKYFLEKQEPKIDRSAEISKQAIIRGNVYIGPNVKVFENAIIHGPVYIAEGCVIANNALVRESMLGKNCVAGFSTEIARSYLNHDVWTHTNYIGDSIVDSNVSFGSGAVVGNLRFDEENVKTTIKGKREDTGTNKFGVVVGGGARLGVNSSTNPGVKIGRNTFVGANVLAERDILDGKLVLLDQKLKVVKNKKAASMEDRGDMKKKLR